MILSEILDGVFITAFAERSMLKRPKIYRKNDTYDTLPFNYKRGLHLTIKEIFIALNKINKHLDSKKEFNDYDVRIIMTYIASAKINRNYLIEVCDFPISYKTGRFIKKDEEIEYIKKVRLEIVCMLNRILEYAIEDLN